MSTPQDYASTVNSFYLAFYGRPADPAGLKFWTEQLDHLQGDLGAITTAFATSEEAQVRFSSGTAATRITQIYEQLFDRIPEADGLAFWIKAVEGGHATLAEVSMSILKGAQGSDLSLSNMRQKAADAFTAQVQASGSAYDGYASIEAARVLVRAVTASATQADLDVLVKAAVSFADTATKTPGVVEAIATGSTLLALFDTSRGKGDPVALAQALSDTAKAAAGDPVTLESLLRGGGMEKVLKVMPAKASLKDVVDALAKGGLPAAVDVVYPTKPVIVPAPAPTLSLSFDHVDESQLDVTPDNVTSLPVADITFKYEGNDLVQGQKFEASIDGGLHWDQVMLVTDTATNTVTAKGVPLTGSQLNSYPTAFLKPFAPKEVTTEITLRAVDAAGKTISAVVKEIVYDGFAATPGVTFAPPVSQNGHHIQGMGSTTGNAAFDIEGIEQGARVEYSVAQPLQVYPGTGTNMVTSGMLFIDTAWSKDKPVLAEGPNFFEVRQIDRAGNVSIPLGVQVTLDTEAPAGTPTIALVEDDGASPTDGITSIAKFAIGGLDTHGDTGWEYSIDNGVTWKFGAVNSGTGAAELDLPDIGNGPLTVQVRQLDAAGNVSPVSNTLNVTVDAGTAQPPQQGTFELAEIQHTLRISGTATDMVLVNLSTDMVARKVSGWVKCTMDIKSVDAQDYAGSVMVIGTAAEISVAAPDFSSGKIAGYVILDTKASIFTGEPGQRSFVSPEIQSLLEGADHVSLAGMLSGEEKTLLEALDGFDMDKVNADWDLDAPARPVVALDIDSGSLSSQAVDRISNVGTYSVTEVEQDAMVQFSKNGTDDWTTSKPVALEGQNTFFVRQVDWAGNVGDSVQFSFVLDTSRPSAPTLSLVEDTGIADDRITAKGDVKISNLEQGATVEFRNSPQDPWSHVVLTDGAGTAVLPIGVEGAKHIEVRQFDQAGNESAIASLAFTVDPNAPGQPGPSGLAAIGYMLGGNPGMLFMHAEDGPIKHSSTDPDQAGFIDKTGFSLMNMATETVNPAYTSGPSFGILGDGILRFGTGLDAGMYLMRWEDDTIATANGYLGAGQASFAGGRNGLISQEGFLLSFIHPEMNSPDNIQFSGAYIFGQDSLPMHIATGGGQDAVYAANVGLSIEYRMFDIDSKAQDLILGFGAGDTILFSEHAAMTIDHDIDGGINWAVGLPSSRLAVGASVEAVDIVVQGTLMSIMSGDSLLQTLKTLNDALALDDLPEGLLILARNEDDGGALFYFNNMNMDNSIDNDELSLVAIFNDGVPQIDDIQLIGSTNSGGIPIPD